MSLRLFSLSLAAGLALVGCDRRVVVEVAPATPVPEPVAKTRTLETSRLGSAVDAYERSPDSANAADVKKALADLDGEIAELEALVAKRTGADRDEAAVKLKNMQSYRTAEVARFTAAQAKVKIGLVPADGRSATDQVEDGAKRVGKSIENAAQKAGDAIKDAVR